MPRPEQGGEAKDKKLNLRFEEGIRRPEGPNSFSLVPFTSLMNMTGDGASLPLLQEMFGLYLRLYWNTWAEINPQRAAPLDLRDGDLIRVISGRNNFV